MSKITIQICPVLKEKLGWEKISIAAENVNEALGKLENEFGEKIREQIYEKGEMKNGKYKRNEN